MFIVIQAVGAAGEMYTEEEEWRKRFSECEASPWPWTGATSETHYPDTSIQPAPGEEDSQCLPIAANNWPHFRPALQSALESDQGLGLESDQGLGLDSDQGLGLESDQGLVLKSDQGLGLPCIQMFWNTSTTYTDVVN